MVETAAGCDTTDMLLVHRVFRREFRLLPRMVRASAGGGVAAGPPAVAAHGIEVVDALHHHHKGEDDLVWPHLADDTVLDADVVARMQHQHEEIAGKLQAGRQLLEAWGREPSGSGADELAAHLDGISDDLVRHLDEEEEVVLPAIERRLTPEQWSEVGRRGMASIPKPRLLLFLGHILEEASPSERTHFLTTNVPPPARLAYKVIGRRRFRNETAALRAGVATG